MYCYLSHSLRSHGYVLSFLLMMALGRSAACISCSASEGLWYVTCSMQQNLLPVEVTYSFQNTQKLLEVTSLNFPIKRCDHCRSSLSGHLCYMFNDMSQFILRTKSLLEVTCSFLQPKPVTSVPRA